MKILRFSLPLSVLAHLLVVTPVILAQPTLLIIEGTDPRLTTVYWTADGAHVVTVSDARVEAWDAATGEKAAETTDLLLTDFPLTYRRVAQPLAWTSDGAYAAVVTDGGRTIQVYARGEDVPTTRIAAGDGRAFRGVVWQPCTTTLVPEYDAFIDAVPVYDGLSGAVVAEIAVADARTRIAYPTFSPSGTQLALVRFAMGRSAVDVYRTDTYAREQVIFDGIASTAPVMVEWLGGQDVFVGMNLEGERGIVDMEDGTWRAVPPFISAWNPDGTVGAGLRDGALILVQAAAGEAALTVALPAYDAEVVRMAWGAGGIAIYRSLPLTLLRLPAPLSPPCSPLVCT